ncbi:hypothetical protein SBA4_6600002 [Candidatus Sulfopaludibacter sp. SbA4]|nr:hypothetical protein SBA4_6600002 [Candidatus Sulfopaludibacter sp. SbA4]
MRARRPSPQTAANGTNLSQAHTHQTEFAKAPTIGYFDALRANRRVFSSFVELLARDRSPPKTEFCAGKC